MSTNYENNGELYQFSAGELAITSISNSNSYITQGFLQAFISIDIKVEISLSAVNPCEGEEVEVVIIDSTGGGTNPSFSWYYNGSLFGGDDSRVTIDSVINQDSIAVIMTNSSIPAPNTDTSWIVIDAIPLSSPYVDFSISENPSCEDDLLSFIITDSTFGGNDPSFQWQQNSNSVGVDSFAMLTDLVNDNDSICVIMTSSESCVDTQQVGICRTAQRIANEVPYVSMSVDNNPLVDGELAYFQVDSVLFEGVDPTYDWYINGGFFAADTTAIELSSSEIIDGDTVSIVLTSDYACLVHPKDTASIKMGLITAHSNILNENIQVYPNPFIDELVINTTSKGYRIKLFDQTGRLVLSQSLGGQMFKLKTDQLSSGLYYLQLDKSGGNSFYYKVIKQ